jgi:hypothetical protein
VQVRGYCPPCFATTGEVPNKHNFEEIAMDEDARKIAGLTAIIFGLETRLRDESLDAATRAALTETLQKSKAELASLQNKG